MKIIKSLAVVATFGTALLVIPGVAGAASVTCAPNTPPGALRTFTVDPALVGGLCYGQLGNLKESDWEALGLVYVDKNGDEGILGFTPGGTAGTWSFDLSVWSGYERLFLGAHFGHATGQGLAGDPDSFIVELSPWDISGSWQLGGVGASLQGLSNLYLLGVKCTEEDEDCGPPEKDVPEPGTLALLGLGLIGLGMRRRKL